MTTALTTTKDAKPTKSAVARNIAASETPFGTTQLKRSLLETEMFLIGDTGMNVVPFVEENEDKELFVGGALVRAADNKTLSVLVGTSAVSRIEVGDAENDAKRIARTAALHIRDKILQSESE